MRRRFEQVVDPPVVAERLQLGLADPRRQSEQLLAEVEPLGQVVDVQQRGVPALQRGEERARVTQPLGHRERLGAERQRALLGLGEVEPVGQRGPELHAERMILVAEARQRLLQQRDAVVVDDPGLGVAAGDAERGLGQRTALVALARELRGGGERLARRRVAGAQLRGAEREQDVEPRLDQGTPVVLRRLLVGERVGGLLGRGQTVRDRLLAPGLREVIGELGRARGALQCLADPPVQADPPAGALALVDRVVDERLGEHVAV